MQNRYTGDIGDYSKLGILRALQSEGLSIAVNWYLTPDENNSDGRHTQYLYEEQYTDCDRQLCDELQMIVDKGDRRVCYLESEKILKAKFYSECLDFRNKTKLQRAALRSEWHTKALETLYGKDIVCLDPDNGLIVSSAEKTPKENKYVLYNELMDYYGHGMSVIYYQHKARKKDDHYYRQFDKLINSGDFPGAEGLSLKFTKTSLRYYFFIIQPGHKKAIKNAIEKMLMTDWKKHFEKRP